ncbi:MAG: alpha/beta fold hydrolase [Myxococcota bacterium]
MRAALEGRADLAIIEPPGTGASRPSATFDYSREAFVGWATDVLEVLGPRVLVFPCYLGFVAQWTAHTRPELVTALALSQTPCWSDMAVWLDRVDSKGVLRLPIVGQVATRARRSQLVQGWYRASAGNNTQAKRLSKHAHTCLDEGGAFCLASLVQGFFHAGPPPRVSHPVWLAWGDADRTHRRSDPNQSVPGCTVTRFGHTGHSSELEDPEAFVTALLAFLETR